MADVLDDGEFWLPSQFLSDDDWLLEKEYMKTVTNGNTNSQKGFTKDVFGVPFNLPGRLAANDLSSVGHEYSNAWPSKLCQVGTGCGCRGPTTTDLSNPKVCSLSSQATWDLLYAAAAGEVAKMKLDEEAATYGSHVSNGGLHMGTLQNHFSTNRDHKSSTPSATDIALYHKLQALRFQQLREQQILKRQQQQAVAYLYHLRHKQGASLLPGPASSPFSRPQQPPKHFGSAMRPVFLDNLPAKKERTGTGVFLPRRAATPAADALKKTGCSTRVATSMNLDLEDMIGSQQLHPLFPADNAVHYPTSKSVQCVDAADSRHRGSNGKRSFRSQPPVICSEVGLPQEWTY